MPENTSDVIQRAVYVMASDPFHSIDYYAKVAELSESRFRHRFTAQIGINPFEYLMRARLEKARAELDQGVPVKIAMKAAGFDDWRHFNKAFKARHKLTPTQYLNQRSNHAND